MSVQYAGTHQVSLIDSNGTNFASETNRLYTSDAANTLNITQVTVTTGGGTLIAANANRLKLRIINTSTNPVYISTNATPSTTNGFYLAGIVGYMLPTHFTGALYAISTGGSALVTLDEEAT